MSVFLNCRMFMLAGLSLVLSACVTLPGHRQIIDEENFFLLISAPNLDVKNKIRFNSAKTDILYLPERAQIELVVADNLGKHQLTIKKQEELVVYHYKLNGREITFGSKEKEWLASQIPIIIDKTGLKYDLGAV